MCPREAVKTKRAHTKTAEMLRFLENQPTNGVGGAIDLTWMWNEQGILDLREGSER